MDVREQPRWVIHIYFPPAGEWIAQSKRKKKKSSQNSFPPHYVCMCGFFSLCETKGTHQGRFITRHVSPMCCCTKIDHKSSPVELCLIKANLFSLNVPPKIKRCARWRAGKKESGGNLNENSWVTGPWRIYFGKFMNKPIMYSQEWFSYSLTFGITMHTHKEAEERKQTHTNRLH